MKGNSPFHIAARLNGSLGNFLKEFVDLYTAKVFNQWICLSLVAYIHVWKTERMIQAEAHFQELLMKNEQDQNPFHIACKSGEIKSGMIVSMIIVEIVFILKILCAGNLEMVEYLLQRDVDAPEVK